MVRPKRASGFTLIELLTVIAIIGIIAGIAIPTFTGQRRRARVLGDAQSSAAVLRMQLETRKADNGTYGASGAYEWKPTGFVGSGTNPAPLFSPGNSKMTYTVTMQNGGLTYQLSVKDPSMGSAEVFRTNQNGSTLYLMQ